MPVHDYGVLKGRPIASRKGRRPTPHFQIHVVDDESDWRIAVNVESQLSPSELLYLVDENFDHAILDTVRNFDTGFTSLDSTPDSGALDFIRANLFDPDEMVPLPFKEEGPDNDLNEKLQAQIRRAIETEEATVYVFGSAWGPENKSDKVFGFRPGRGVHNVHMNQGNAGRFRDDDGVWQDGAMLIHFPAISAPDGSVLQPEHWVGIFLAFQSQSWHTSDESGHALGPGGQPSEPDVDVHPPHPGDRRVRIIASMVNPAGHDPGRETVTLINVTPEPIDLSGWAIADRLNRKSTLAGPVLAAGETTRITLDGNGAQLANSGGIITLLDADDLKVNGVSYTNGQVREQGATVVW